jgi:hypothetical protein
VKKKGKSTAATPDEPDLEGFGKVMADEIRKIDNQVYGNIRAYRLGVANGMDDEVSYHYIIYNKKDV